MAFNNVHSNDKIKRGFPPTTGGGGQWSRRRWTRLQQMTGNYNKWFLENDFSVPSKDAKGKIKMIKIKCPQHIVDTINLQFRSRNDWINMLPGYSNNANIKFEAYRGKSSPPSESGGDLYVDTMWPHEPQWDKRYGLNSDVKSKYQIIRFIASGKTEASAKVSPAAMTRLQETGSALVFKHVLTGTLKNPVNAIKIAMHKPLREELDSMWRATAGVPCDMGWIENFYKQQKALLVALSSGGYSGNNQFEEFQRDGPFMTFIMNEFIGSKNWSGISGKDNWNPADIWLIKNQTKHINDLRQLMSTPTAGNSSFRKRLFASKISQFNSYMRELFKKKEIWGISLKLVTQKEAKWEFVNVDDAYFATLENKQFKLGSGTYKTTCKLSTNHDDGAEAFDSQDSILWVEDGDSVQYKFQVKANTSTKRDNLKYEATQKGFGAARLGKATAEYVEGLITAYKGNHFKNDWKDFEKSNKEYPYTINEFKDWKDKINDMAEFLDSQGVLLNIKPKDAYNRIVGAAAKTPHVANSKVMQMSWLCTIISINKTGDNNIDEFLTDLVFMSKKEGKQYGPFLKLY